MILSLRGPILVAIGCLATAAATASFMISAGDLVVHWNLAGQPDGMLPGTAAWATTGGVGAVAAVLVLIVNHGGTADRNTWQVAAGLGAAVLFTGLGLVVAVANAGQGEPRPPLVLLAAVVVLTILAPLTGHLRTGRHPEAGEPRWRGRCRSRFALPTGIAFLAAAVALGVLVHPAMGVAVATGGVTILALVEIRVEVTSTRLRITFGGLLRWPRMTIDLRDVQSVEVIEVDPPRYGGWGYRGSLRFMGRAAINLRRGPGLLLALANGARFILTVDDVQDAAEAIRSAIRPHF